MICTFNVLFGIALQYTSLSRTIRDVTVYPFRDSQEPDGCSSIRLQPARR